MTGLFTSNKHRTNHELATDRHRFVDTSSGCGQIVRWLAKLQQAD